MRFLAVTLAIARKDLLAEVRGREVIPSLVQFAVLALVVANFAFDLDGRSGARVASGILWLVLVFAGLVAFGRAFATEQEPIEHVLLTGAGAAPIFAGKALAAAAGLVALEAVLLPAMAVLLGLPISGAAVGAAVLATIGISALGCLFAALAARTRARELLLPLLAIPLWIPFIVTGAKVVEGAPAEALVRLGVLDILFLVVAAAAAQFVLDD